MTKKKSSSKKKPKKEPIIEESIEETKSVGAKNMILALLERIMTLEHALISNEVICEHVLEDSAEAASEAVYEQFNHMIDYASELDRIDEHLENCPGCEECQCNECDECDDQCKLPEETKPDFSKN